MKNLTEAERFNAIRLKAGLTYREFGKTLGLAETHISNIVHGHRRLSREVLQKLKEVYGVDLNLFLADGTDTAKVTETVYLELIRQEAAAGAGMEIEDYPEKVTIAVPAEMIAPYPASQIQALTVHGDSMTGEAIFDGDIVLINRTITQGDYIFVLSIGSTLLVKRVQTDAINKTITLLSANPAYPPRTITGPDRETIKIEGKVIAWMHKV